jgi:hypothetical protein
VFGLTLEFRQGKVSKTTVFDTSPCFVIFSELEGYRFVSKPVSKSTSQYLATIMSFDTNETP